MLRYLALDDHHCHTLPLFGDENFAALAASLRAIEPADEFPYFTQVNLFSFEQLGLLTNLTYLGVKAPSSTWDNDRLLTALSRMPKLRALAVDDARGSFLAEFPAHCPLLEHLTLSCALAVSVEQLGRALASFPELVSLHIYLYSFLHPSDASNMKWLRATTDRGRLEYFQLENLDHPPKIPASFVAGLIRKCKVGNIWDVMRNNGCDWVNLQGLYALILPPQHPDYSFGDYRSIVYAAMQVDAEWREREVAGCKPNPELPTLHINGIMPPA